MSTRVHKGGTVFRPVTKARPRMAESASRQPSVSLDSHAPSPTFSHAQQSPLFPPPREASVLVMPPPSAVPVRPAFQKIPDCAAPPFTQIPHLNIPIVVSSSTAPPPIQAAEPQVPLIVEEVATIVGPSQPSVIEDPHERSRKRRELSHSLTTTTSKKLRKPRRPATPAFDIDADPGEILDPTSITMATLCEDTGQGRVSSKAAQILGNHLAWKKSNKEKRARMRTLMEARKYGRNEDGETTQAPRHLESASDQTSAANATPESSTQSTSGALPTIEDTSGHGFDYSQDVATSHYNVQVRIGPNGETIVDDESLFVDRNAEEDTAEYTHVEESDVTKFVNSATYAKRFRGSRWSAEETELFYDALSQFGENYELISYVLPGRDRKACKNKFKAEDKRNSRRIDFCLNNRRPYDIQTLSRMTGKDFSGPTPEIQAPAVLSLAEPQDSTGGGQPCTTGTGHTKEALSAVLECSEEILGDITSFDP
ncbi:hypothetical protein PAXRUDRAFT_820983 [Paxillus rubicundulus Ve08.2h10]|uniref:Transcription factor TFIIIB component B n=1 Tax=Paxillus rubicundulus Ve08.2h10 TaxID=930991 RepID=A0A0D0DYS0_9AGAM|nr:hypothetical protein PAXRUDRAFT_820983 [Paxillus rubicundulus Ve08.2h10]